MIGNFLVIIILLIRQIYHLPHLILQNWPMSFKPKDSISKDQVPVCYSSFFRVSQSENFIQIESCRSFSKSSQKKLKLINQSRSLEKSVQFLNQKRKIKPLKLRVACENEQQKSKKKLCSIKGFKQKINKITQQSSMSVNQQDSPYKNLKTRTENTDISESKSTSKTSENSRYYQLLNSNQVIKPIQLLLDPFPTLGNSLVVKQSIFSPQSLLESNPNTIPSVQVSLNTSPTHKLNSQYKNNFNTPNKNIYMNIDTPTTTIQQTMKKQKLTLNNARRVETFQTLKTENDLCYSVTEENQYHRFFDNIAYPDYFRVGEWKNNQGNKSKKVFKSQTQTLNFND